MRGTMSHGLVLLWRKTGKENVSREIWKRLGKWLFSINSDGSYIKRHFYWTYQTFWTPNTGPNHTQQTFVDQRMKWGKILQVYLLILSLPLFQRLQLNGMSPKGVVCMLLLLLVPLVCLVSSSVLNFASTSWSTWKTLKIVPTILKVVQKDTEVQEKNFSGTDFGKMFSVFYVKNLFAKVVSTFAHMLKVILWGQQKFYFGNIAFMCESGRGPSNFR